MSHAWGCPCTVDQTLGPGPGHRRNAETQKRITHHWHQPHCLYRTAANNGELGAPRSRLGASKHRWRIDFHVSRIPGYGTGEKLEELGFEGFFLCFPSDRESKSKDVISEFTGLQVGETRPGPGRVRVRVRRTLALAWSYVLSSLSPLGLCTTNGLLFLNLDSIQHLSYCAEKSPYRFFE